MDIKPSNIKINKYVDSAVIDQVKNAFNYDPLLEISQSKIMTNEEMSEMIDTINNKLNRDDHILIYKMLRKQKNRNFFSINSSVTHFNITELDNKLKWELYRFVCLCRNNISRIDTIKKAKIEYKQGLNTINETDSATDIDGLSEQDKFKDMLVLNEIKELVKDQKTK